MLEVTNAMQFQNALKEFAEKTKQAPRIVTFKLMLNISRQTIWLSRVDTGRLVHAWQISMTPRPSFKEVPVTGEKVEEIPTKLKSIAQVELEMRPYNDGVIWFANSVEYATHREYGTASTPGDYMLKRSIQMAKSRMKDIIKAAQNELS